MQECLTPPDWLIWWLSQPKPKPSSKICPEKLSTDFDFLLQSGQFSDVTIRLVILFWAFCSTDINLTLTKVREQPSQLPQNYPGGEVPRLQCNVHSQYDWEVMCIVACHQYVDLLNLQPKEASRHWGSWYWDREGYAQVRYWTNDISEFALNLIFSQIHVCRQDWPFEHKVGFICCKLTHSAETVNVWLLHFKKPF